MKKVPGPSMAGSGRSPPPVSRACVRKHATLPPGVHAHDGAQQLAALDRMVPALLSLPSHRCLLHDPALLHQGKHGFERPSDVKSRACREARSSCSITRETPRFHICGFQGSLPGLSREERWFLSHILSITPSPIPTGFICGQTVYTALPGFVSTFPAVTCAC